MMKKIHAGKMKVVWILAACLGLVSSLVFAELPALVQERNGVATMQGEPVTLLGPEIAVGDKAPDFVVQAPNMSDVRLSDLKGKVTLIASVPSLDTMVCRMEIHRFNEEAVSTFPGVTVLFISMDLPFAQKRFCKTDGILGVRTLSDHRTADFGEKYGVLIKGMRLLSRAIFIVGPRGNVRYVEYVKENINEPDYDKALKVLKELAQK
ncbi:MAG: thiol peroxidase [Candidatus Omnitrophota bacterium]